MTKTEEIMNLHRDCMSKLATPANEHALRSKVEELERLALRGMGVKAVATVKVYSNGNVGVNANPAQLEKLRGMDGAELYTATLQENEMLTKEQIKFACTQWKEAKARDGFEKMGDLIDEIRDLALRGMGGEAVAWRHWHGEENDGWEYYENAHCPDCQALYTAPAAELAAKTAECEKWKLDWEEESGEHAEHIAQAKFELAAITRDLAEAKAEAERNKKLAKHWQDLACANRSVAEKKQAEADRLRERCAQLWKLLDDIDTASDAFKTNYEGLAKYIYNTQRKRFAIMSGEEFEAIRSAKEKL
jgi:hypothetical protein